MSTATRHSPKRTIARIQRLCCLGIGGEMLISSLLREVDDLVPSRNGMFLWAGPRQELINIYATGPAATLLPIYLTEYHNQRERDLLMTFTEAMRADWPSEAGDFFARTLKVDRDDFARSDLFNQLYRPIGGEQGMLLRVRERGKPLGAIGLLRSSRETSFSSADSRRLESIAAFIAHAVARRSETETFVAGEEHSLIIADRDGRIRHAGSDALPLLLMALHPRWSPATRWQSLNESAPEIVSLCRALCAVGRGVAGCPPPTLQRRNQWGDFVLRAYWLGPTDGEELTEYVGVTIERRLPRALAAFRHIEQLPLTSREKELCLLLARNPARQDLAHEMGVGASTVVTHMRNIYAKLGVHGRSALIDALFPR
jgi:DNA-binding CsgD family transcriptional regulator